MMLDKPDGLGKDSDSSSVSDAELQKGGGVLGAMEESSNVRGGVRGCLHRLWTCGGKSQGDSRASSLSFKVIFGTVKQSPAILIIPVLLMCLTIGLGVFGAVQVSCMHGVQG